MIELKNVNLSYTKEYATLMNINAKFDSNTFIIGNIDDGTIPLFRIISKIEKNYTGECYINGINLKDIKDKDLNLSYLPSEPYLFKNKTIFDNLYYPLKIRKIKKKDAYNTINEAIDNYLTNFPQKVKDMTISQQKIIALVRAMIRRPKYLLIENLFENLDIEYIDLAYKIISKTSQYSLILACEPKNIDCYANYIKHTLSYGSLI